MSRTLLVTGASGHLGREVVQALAGGPDRVIAGTRDPSKLADLGIDVRRVDFDDPAGLAEAFAGIDRLLIVSTDSMVPGVRATQHRTAVDAAERAGVGHVVYTSFLNAGPGASALVAPDHVATERALADSGLSYTVLRNSLYADVLLGALPQAVALGQLFTARADGAVSYVTRSDCARTAAAALASDFDGRRTLDVTGPQALDGDALAAIVSAVAKRPVAHVPLPEVAYRQALGDAGLPAPVVDLLVSFEVAAARGELATVAGTVEQLTGHATTVREFLNAHRSALG